MSKEQNLRYVELDDVRLVEENGCYTIYLCDDDRFGTKYWYEWENLTYSASVEKILERALGLLFEKEGVGCD